MLQKESQGRHGADCGSPLQWKRIGLRPAMLIRTPDARAQRKPARRATGQGSRRTAGRDHSTVVEDHRSGSSIPEGDQLPTDHADQMRDDSQHKKAVSPVSRVPLRWHSESSVQQYAKGLQLSEHRWVLVGEDIRGAYLCAVAGYDCGTTGDICIIVWTKSLAFPLLQCGKSWLMLQFKLA